MDFMNPPYPPQSTGTTMDFAEPSADAPAHGNPENDNAACRKVRFGFRFLAVALALAETYVARNVINPDGRSYLDLARAYLRHDWAMTVNAHWSPFYAWLLTLTLGITHPSLRWVYPVVHAMNFVLFLGCLAAFEFFWSGLARRWRPPSDSAHYAGLRPVTFWLLGYSLFIWMAVGTLLSMINPDLCVAALVLLIAGILVRLHAMEGDAWGWHAVLGVALGVGYLTKSIMFPAGFLFIVASLRSWPASKKWLPAGVALLTFLGVAAPQIALLSSTKGRLTFSDSGWLNYAWRTYDLPLRNWQGHDGNGTPLHPTREVYRNPDVFEFNGPIRATYPPWQDPSYWNAGMRPRFDFGQVARHTEARVIELFGLLTVPKYWLAAMVLILLGADLAATARGVVSCWYLILPGAAVLAMYALTCVEFRYLPPWLLLLWAGFLFGVRLRGRLANSWMYRGLAGLVAILLLAATAYGAYGQWRHGREDDATPEYATAEGLRKMGLPSGTKVGAIGFDNDAHWAYLDRFYVVAEINADQACTFWSAPAPVQRAVLETFAKAGARAVVANAGGGIKSTDGASLAVLKSCSRVEDGWQRIQGSPNLVYVFR
jgi:hypothetical protein